MNENLIESGALLSQCRTYRYTLWRIWSEIEPCVAFIGLNPSTADEKKDDPTIRRCIGFAKSWGYGGIVMLNLFAYRSTDPRRLPAADDPVGPDNDGHLCSQHSACVMTVAAWGVHGALRDRGRDVHAMLGKLHHLGLTKDGHPKHPLYLPGSTQPIEWNTPTLCTEAHA